MIREMQTTPKRNHKPKASWQDPNRRKMFRQWLSAIFFCAAGRKLPALVGVDVCFCQMCVLVWVLYREERWVFNVLPAQCINDYTALSVNRGRGT